MRKIAKALAAISLALLIIWLGSAAVIAYIAYTAQLAGGQGQGTPNSAPSIKPPSMIQIAVYKNGELVYTGEDPPHTNFYSAFCQLSAGCANGVVSVLGTQNSLRPSMVSTTGTTFSYVSSGSGSAQYITEDTGPVNAYLAFQTSQTYPCQITGVAQDLGHYQIGFPISGTPPGKIPGIFASTAYSSCFAGNNYMAFPYVTTTPTITATTSTTNNNNNYITVSAVFSVPNPIPSVCPETTGGGAFDYPCNQVAGAALSIVLTLDSCSSFTYGSNGAAGSCSVSSRFTPEIVLFVDSFSAINVAAGDTVTVQWTMSFAGQQSNSPGSYFYTNLVNSIACWLSASSTTAKTFSVTDISGGTGGGPYACTVGKSSSTPPFTLNVPGNYVVFPQVGILLLQVLNAITLQNACPGPGGGVNPNWTGQYQGGPTNYQAVDAQNGLILGTGGSGITYYAFTQAGGGATYSCVYIVVSPYFTAGYAYPNYGQQNGVGYMALGYSSAQSIAKGQAIGLRFGT